MKTVLEYLENSTNNCSEKIAVIILNLEIQYQYLWKKEKIL